MTKHKQKQSRRDKTNDDIFTDTQKWSVDSLKQFARKTFRDETWYIQDYFITYSFGSGMHVQSFRFFDLYNQDIDKLLQTLVTTQTLLVHPYPKKCEVFDKTDVRLPLVITYDQHVDKIGRFEWRHRRVVESTWKDFVLDVWDIQCRSAEETKDHYVLLDNLYQLFQQIYKKANMQLENQAVKPNTQADSKSVLYVRKLINEASTTQVRELCEQYGTVNAVEPIWERVSPFSGKHMLVTFEKEADARTTQLKLNRANSHLARTDAYTPKQLLVEFAEANLINGMDDLIQFAPAPKNVKVFVEHGFCTGFQGGFRYFVVMPETHYVYCFTGYNEAR